MSDLSLLDGDFPLTAEFLTPVLLDMPQASCPVYHRFGPGIYIRELQADTGTLIVGHIQKQDHTNILLKGKLQMFNEDGSTYVVSAPLIYTGKANSRKVALVLEDMVWQNVYATTETNIDKLEETYLEQDSAKTTAVNLIATQQKEELQYVRDDYSLFLTQFGVTEEHVQQLVQIDDVVDFDSPHSLRVSNSNIQGKGLFTTAPITQGSYIAKARINNCRTPAGRYTNHSPTPNCKFILLENGDIGMVALQNINGCMGGSVGTELTVNYRDVMSINPVLERA